jgi:hypothetical protein
VAAESEVAKPDERMPRSRNRSPESFGRADSCRPHETTFAGLTLRAEIEVKGMRLRSPIGLSLEAQRDGSLTLRSNLHAFEGDL